MPDGLVLKDIGFLGAAHRIEAFGEYMYVAYTSAIATYDISTDRSVQVGNMYVPGKITDLKIHGDHLFVTGEFGLRVYRLSSLLTAGGRPDPTASYSGVLLNGIAIASYSGSPVSGVLVAAHELYDPAGTPRIFFFQWHEESESLAHISMYAGDAFLNENNPKPGNCNADRKYIQKVALDPLNPKLYAGACNEGWIPLLKINCCYIHEFDISDIHSPVLTGDVQIDRGFIPSDMDACQDTLWVALSGTGSTAVFYAYDLYPDRLLTERTAIHTCSQIPGGFKDLPGSGQCTSDAQCAGGGAQCVETCINGECQCCFTGAFGYLDIIPEDELVVAVAGMSTDNPNKHNVFLFDLHAPASQRYADATSESINFSFDVAGIPGNILIADEWTHAHGLQYSKNPLSIAHHREPAWMETRRAFSPGWHMINIWENNGRIYGGHNLFMSADMKDLGNYTQWRTFAALEDRQWIFPKGAHSGRYIFAKGTRENFLVIDHGTRLFLIYEDPATGNFSLVNNGDPLHYHNQNGFYDTSGWVLWPHENVGFAPIGNQGLYAYYLDPPAGVIEERNSTADIRKLRTAGLATEGYTDIAFVSDEIIAASVGIQGPHARCSNEPDQLGGIHFYRVSYPEGIPDTSNKNRPIHFEFIQDVKALRCKNIPFLIVRDGWIMTVARSSATYIDDVLVYFRYDSVAAMNAEPNQNRVLSNMTLPIANFNPPTSGKALWQPVFWGQDKIAVPANRAQANTTDNNGVYVFDRTTKEQLYFYPATYHANAYYYQHNFLLHADSDVHYLPPPEAVMEASNGDLYVGTHSGQIARLGKPDPG